MLCQQNSGAEPYACKEEIMKARNRFVLPVMLLFLSAASFAQQVKTDYDRSVDFTQYKTYSWQKVATKDPLWEGRIKSAVDQALTAKGLKEVPSGGDLSLVAIEATKNQQSLNTFYNGEFLQDFFWRWH
jgi:hypothetical protein